MVGLVDGGLGLAYREEGGARMSEKIKFCKDCKHCKKMRLVFTTEYSCRVDNRIICVDVITGETRYEKKSCSQMREGKCGPEGKLYEKEPWWRRFWS